MEQPTERELKEIQLIRQLKEAKKENQRVWDIYYEASNRVPEKQAWIKSNKVVEAIEQQLKELEEQ